MKNPVFPAVGDLTQIKDMTLEAFERMFPELEYFRLSQTKGFDTDYEEFYQQKTPLSRKYVGPILLNVAFERDPLVTEQALHGTEISHEMRFRVSMPQLEARKFYPSLGDVLKFTDFNPVEGEVIYEVMAIERATDSYFAQYNYWGEVELICQVLNNAGIEVIVADENQPLLTEDGTPIITETEIEVETE